MELTLKIALLCMTISMHFFLFISPTYAAKPAEEEAEVVDKFCNQRSLSKDRAFCLRVLKSVPTSSSAKDNHDLLKIAVGIAVSNAKKTRDFISEMSKSKTIQKPVKDALEGCILAYNGSIKQLGVVIEDLDDDPPMTIYDAHMARLLVSGCQESLLKGNVVDEALTSRHNIAIEYARLYEEISRSV